MGRPLCAAAPSGHPLASNKIVCSSGPDLALICNHTCDSWKRCDLAGGVSSSRGWRLRDVLGSARLGRQHWRQSASEQAGRGRRTRQQFANALLAIGFGWPADRNRTIKVIWRALEREL